MTTQTLGRRGMVAAAIVWLAALMVWHALATRPQARLIAVGVALDLTVTAALVSYFFSRRSSSALAVGALGLTLATIAVPPARPLAALLEPLLLLLTLTRLSRLRRVYRARRAGGDEPTVALGDALAATLGSRALGHAMATELTMLGLALGGWFRRPPRAGFYAHKKTPWLMVLCVLLFLVAVESVGTHLVLMHLSRPAALVVSLLALYSVVWLIGDYQALRLRPSTIADGVLRLRVGLRWSARIALSDLAAPGSVVRVESLPPGALRATVMGAPNLVLRASGIARGPLGIERAFTQLAIHVDEPEAFLAALEQD